MTAATVTVFYVNTQDNESGFGLIFGIYTVMYFVMALSLLLNFFLAIVIDSYATVQDVNT